MSKYLPYTLGTLFFGVFQGLLFSGGNDIVPSVLISCLFWAGMLTPMLIDEKEKNS